VTPKLTGMAKRGGVAVGARDGQGGRGSREDVVVGMAKTTVPSGGRGSGDEDVGCGNMGRGRWGGEANGI
jgi:hypothetical protein